MTDSAGRQARYRQRLQDKGLQQVMLLAPAETHATLRYLAGKLRDGVPLHLALQAATLAVRNGGAVAPIVPPELTPTAGYAAVAVRLKKWSSGHSRRCLVSKFGLHRDRGAGVWAGLVAVDRLPALRAFVSDAERGSVVVREAA